MSHQRMNQNTDKNTSGKRKQSEKGIRNNEALKYNISNEENHVKYETNQVLSCISALGEHM